MYQTDLNKPSLHWIRESLNLRADDSATDGLVMDDATDAGRETGRTLIGTQSRVISRYSG